MSGSQEQEQFAAGPSGERVATQLSAQIAHSIPGRLRLRVSGLNGHPDALAQVAKRLGCLEGVRSVALNQRARSVVLEYNPNAKSTLLASLCSVFPDFLDHRQAPKHQINSRHRPQTPNLAGEITELFGRVNTEVEKATGGVDLKTLVPLTLLALSVLGLLAGAVRRRKLPAPTWYDLLWFAFNTFMILNLTGASPIKQQSAEKSEQPQDS